MLKKKFKNQACSIKRSLKIYIFYLTVLYSEIYAKENIFKIPAKMFFAT